MLITTKTELDRLRRIEALILVLENKLGRLSGQLAEADIVIAQLRSMVSEELEEYRRFRTS